MTLEQLRAFGCNVDEGLQRCMNNESFYFMLINKFLSSTDLSKLENALNEHDLDTAFKKAHSLKGVCGNLSLTPLFNVLIEMVEPLRAKVEMDYLPLFNKLNEYKMVLSNYNDTNGILKPFETQIYQNY